MKRNHHFGILFIALSLAVNLFTGCEKDKGPNTPVPENDSISMGAGYANDIFYSFENGKVAEVSRTNWDIAFSVDAQSSAILINEAAGVELKVYPTQDGWQFSDAVDTAGYNSWDLLLNPDTTWADGAFGANATGHPNYGWGNYNATSHNVEGCALYIIKLRNGEFRKIFIEMKYSTQQKYTFKYAALDGSNESSVDLDVSDSDANFVYYDLENGTRLDREPSAASWDLLFTKYKDNSMVYDVTGVLLNPAATAAEIDATDLENVSWTEDDFSDDISTIGWDWKTFNMDAMAYVVDAERVFVVKTQDESVYALQFTAFDYTTGKFVFTTLKK